MRKLRESVGVAGLVGALAVAAVVTFFAIAADSSPYADGTLEPFFAGAPAAPAERPKIDAYIEAHAFMLNALGAPSR